MGFLACRPEPPCWLPAYGVAKVAAEPAATAYNELVVAWSARPGVGGKPFP
jgi:hypothetical protein